MKLIVQIPAFNEETTVGQTLRDIPRKIDGFTAVETLVIDDGSSDKTVEAARKAGATHIVELRTHRGLAAAFRAGLDAALRLGADVIVNTDADNQYAGADITKLVAPIVRGNAEVVIGDREVASSPHMSPFKRLLQRAGSWTVSLASGLDVADVTSGFRAFTREAALQLNVFNPFTYTLETIIQSGNRNLAVQTVPVRTNAPTRPSRLYRGIGSYLRKSAATIFRIYTLYRPLKTFFLIGSLLLLAGIGIGSRFLYFFFHGDRAGHIQSLILAAVFLIVGFQTLLIGLLADLIAVNRRLSEETLIRLRKLESAEPERKPRRDREPARNEQPRPDRPPRRDRSERPERPDRAATNATPASTPATPAPAAQPATQWVWLLDEDKLQDRVANTPKPPKQQAPATSAAPAADVDDFDEDDDTATREPRNGEANTGGGSGGGGNRRRRRRGRGGVRPHPELPGNRGKHLADE